MHERDKEYDNGYKKEVHEEAQIPYDSDSLSQHAIRSDQTHRQLRPRHIQLIGIGGTIGTALYVQIGKGLLNGGPGSLFLAFTIWCTFILAVTNVSERISHALLCPKQLLINVSPTQASPKQLTPPQVYERDGDLLTNFFAIHSFCWSLRR